MFFKYLYQYRRFAAIFLLFAGIFAAMLYLYGAPPEAVLYAVLICLAVSVPLILVHFLRFRGRLLLLRGIYRNLPLMTESIPAPKTPVEEALVQIIERLSELNRETSASLECERQESIDYYTVWLHQIKTPIAAMRLLLQSEDTDANRELSSELFKIEQYAAMALGYLRLDSPSTDFVFREYSLGEIVRKAVHGYAPLFIRRRIRLLYSEPDVLVLTDEKWLVFIVEQLLSNAVKYTAKGSVTIDCEGKVLRISDTGIGIAAEDLPRIFEKGFTGLGGRTEGKSTGLGLYLCKKTADRLGHKLSVTSEAGKGTSFYIDLNTEKLEVE